MGAVWVSATPALIDRARISIKADKQEPLPLSPTIPARLRNPLFLLRAIRLKASGHGHGHAGHAHDSVPHTHDPTALPRTAPGSGSGSGAAAEDAVSEKEEAGPWNHGPNAHVHAADSTDEGHDTSSVRDGRGQGESAEMGSDRGRGGNHLSFDPVSFFEACGAGRCGASGHPAAGRSD